MSNKVYDILKYIAQIVLPACATLYFALAGIWNLPFKEEIVGTITAIDTFLGILLGISSMKYVNTQIDENTLDELENGLGDDEDEIETNE